MVLPRLITDGDPRHGVVRYARELAAAVGALAGVDAPADAPLHLQVTDRLWGASPGAAADRFEQLARTTALTVTLHDLPQASDGPRNQVRRGVAYARIARAARGVVVSSRHEAALLTAITDVPATVIPLPVDPLPRAAGPRPQPDDVVALLGFVYPGKGHAEVLAAVARLGPDRPGVVALGGASAGHEDDVEALHARARELDVAFSVTGFLAEDELVARVRRARVPVVAHQHVSASGSAVTWVQAGRRPLVPATAYWLEMDALRPGTLAPHPPEELPAAIAAARRDPASTWWAEDATTTPGLREVAAAHLAWWGGVAW